MKLVNRLTYSHTLSLRGVEQVRAVDVHLDAGLRLGLAVGVAAEVVAPLEDQHLQPELGGAAFGDRQAEEAGSDDDEIVVHEGVLLERCVGQLAPGLRAPGRRASVSLIRREAVGALAVIGSVSRGHGRRRGPGQAGASRAARRTLRRLVPAAAAATASTDHRAR